MNITNEQPSLNKDKILKCNKCGLVHLQTDRRIVVNETSNSKKRYIVYSKESQCANIACKSIDYTTIS